MKTLLIALFMLLPFGLMAQTFPTDKETGRITYAEVVPVEGATQKELYTKARQWVAETFKSANHVLQMDTPDKIVVKGVTKYYTSGMSPGSDLHFMAVIELKDGRYKYTVTNFSSNGNTPIESDLLNPKVIYKKDGTVRAFNAGIVSGIEKAMQELNESIKSGMASDAKKNDW